ITPTLQLQDGASNLGTLTFNLSLGATGISFAEYFDGVTAPALPAGWTTLASGTQSPWLTSTAAKDTAPNAAFSADPANAGVNALVSPVIAIVSPNAQLSFRNNYNLYVGHGNNPSDGAILEITIGTGNFTNI